MTLTSKKTILYPYKVSLFLLEDVYENNLESWPMAYVWTA